MAFRLTSITEASSTRRGQPASGGLHREADIKSWKALHRGGKSSREGGFIAIGDAETAAAINGFNAKPGLSEDTDEIGNAAKCVP
jgi:hypothetical protein